MFLVKVVCGPDRTERKVGGSDFSEFNKEYLGQTHVYKSKL